jgi:hypothetical protein
VSNAGLVWLVFFKLRLLPWNWPGRIAAILAVFLGLLNDRWRRSSIGRFC